MIRMLLHPGFRRTATTTLQHELAADAEDALFLGRAGSYPAAKNRWIDAEIGRAFEPLVQTDRLQSPPAGAIRTRV